jgi:hypothetical protein
MESLIPIINQLQDVFQMTGMAVQLPQIVVVGAQVSQVFENDLLR